MYARRVAPHWPLDAPGASLESAAHRRPPAARTHRPLHLSGGGSGARTRAPSILLYGRLVAQSRRVSPRRRPLDASPGAERSARVLAAAVRGAPLVSRRDGGARHEATQHHRGVRSRRVRRERYRCARVGAERTRSGRGRQWERERVGRQRDAFVLVPVQQRAVEQRRALEGGGRVGLVGVGRHRVGVAHGGRDGDRRDGCERELRELARAARHVECNGRARRVLRTGLRLGARERLGAARARRAGGGAVRERHGPPVPAAVAADGPRAVRLRKASVAPLEEHRPAVHGAAAYGAAHVPRPAAQSRRAAARRRREARARAVRVGSAAGLPGRLSLRAVPARAALHVGLLALSVQHRTRHQVGAQPPAVPAVRRRLALREHHFGRRLPVLPARRQRHRRVHRRLPPARQRPHHPVPRVRRRHTRAHDGAARIREYIPAGTSTGRARARARARVRPVLYFN